MLMGIENDLLWEHNFSVAAGVFPVGLLAYKFSMVCAVNWP